MLDRLVLEVGISCRKQNNKLGNNLTKMTLEIQLQGVIEGKGATIKYYVINVFSNFNKTV